MNVKVESRVAAAVPPASPGWPAYKRLLPRTLLGRSLLIIVSPLVLLQIISTWIFYDRHYDTTTKRLAEGVAGDIAVVTYFMDRAPQAIAREELYSLAAESMWLYPTFVEGAHLSIEKPTLWRELFGGSILYQKLTQALQTRLPHPFVIDTYYGDENVEVQVQLRDGVLQVLVPRERLFSSTTYIFIMWMVGTSIVLFAVATMFMRNQVKPIRRLAVAAESFGKGRDVPDFKPEGAAEVRQAATAFLRMRERIRRQIQQRTEMLAGVSHDLRTPLTRMKLQLAMLRDAPEVDNLKSDVCEMEKMVEGYLAFARGEGGERPRPTSLSGMLRELTEQAKRDGGAIDLHIEQEMTVPLMQQSFRRCLNNLISNARRYGDHVSIRAGPRQNAIEITIDDDGPGIPKDKRSEVFRPFYRLDQSRNPETGGTGLGLTIARDVVHGHGGDLLLDEAPAGGLRVRLRLPV
jgi:two-component system osmolarity sensor histidine kinase EnvZ